MLFLKNSYAWLLASLVGCAGLLLGLRLAEGQPAWLLVILGPLWAIGTHLALSPIFVMLRWRAYRGDQDREWLARLSAAKLRVVLGWAVFAAICLLPLDAHVRAVVGGAFGDSAAHKAITGAITLASGLFAALFGKSDTPLVRSGKKPGVFSIATATTLATAIFALGLLALLSWGGEALARAMPDGVPIWARPFALAAALFLGSRLADIPVNVNRFSLHGMYRNRLERAFLGSVRPTQGEGARGDADHAGTRDPFTDFDPLDNIAMADLRPAEPARWKLFPVVNVALNLTNAETTRRAWAERKAGPFSITPLACGSDSLPRGKGFVDSLHFGSQENEQGAHAAKRGFSLASAITISGAAASPNMGYHSSSATAFLMTLFNVRLGAWLANPAVSSRNKLARSVSTQRALFSELLGLSDGTSPAIYLSDGGHFDNLGLYAMVRRGCRRIVVIDAAADPECAFEDLGNAVRKIEIDLAVSIDFGVMPMAGRADWKDGNRAWAVAKITWNAFPQAAPGKLLYIKASLPPGVPADVLATAREDAAFPHDSTANQFFTESKFESYRKLGRFLVGQLPGTATGLDALFEGLVDEEARIAQSLEQQ